MKAQSESKWTAGKWKLAVGVIEPDKVVAGTTSVLSVMNPTNKSLTPSLCYGKVVGVSGAKIYEFDKTVSEARRDFIVLQLRRDGFSASREVDTLRTDATIGEIAISTGHGLNVSGSNRDNKSLPNEE